MCNREIHNKFIKMNQSYCLYCDKYLKTLQYKIIKYKDICNECDNSNYIIDNNTTYCKHCAGLIKYFNADLLQMQINKKKQSIYQRKYYIYKVHNIVMNEYQKYVILGYYV